MKILLLILLIIILEEVESVIENLLSRDGTSPNEMNVDLDMNLIVFFNLPEVSNTEPVQN